MYRIIRIKLEAGWDIPGELSHHRIDIYKYVNGNYIAKFTIKNEMGEIVAIENELSTKRIEELLKCLFTVNLPAVPKREAGCDISYTEIEVAGDGGKSLFGWTTCPHGWEELDKLTTKIIKCSGFYIEDECL